jgi:hypothetical protein
MKRGLTVRGVVFHVAAVAACAGSLSAVLWAQDPASGGSSLGDLARQTRAQHASEPDHKASNAQAMVDEMQQEQEASDNAPVGFKNYDAGDYRLFVPYPFSLEGRDNGGAVLAGSQVGITNTLVMAGTPIPFPANLSDSDQMNLVQYQVRQYGATASCSPFKQGEHKVFRCSLNNANLLGRPISGSMEFIVASNRLIPVLCASPDEMRNCSYNAYGVQTCGPRYPSWEQTQRYKAAQQTQTGDQRTSTQACEQIIYPSIQLKEDIVVHPATIPDGKLAPIVATAVTTPVQAGAESGSQSPSLAELARQTRQTQRGKALDNTEGSRAAPMGFQSFVLQFCQNPQQCAEASVVIPENAEVVSRTNGQHIFKAPLDGESVMLYAGPADVNAPYRSLTDADYIRMRDLANSNGWSHEKVDAVSTQDLTIEGRPSLLTRFRYQRDQKRWWIGERVLIGNRGAQFLVGCAAPEEHFADAEAVCTTMVNSLRLP